MKKFCSISERPGTTGTFFYNYFFKKFNINASYTAYKADKNNFFDVVDLLVKDNHGISVSMPFKSEIIKYIKNKNGLLHNDVLNFNSCNTVIVSDNELSGFNCDLSGVHNISNLLDKNKIITILGNGAIGSMFYNYLLLNNFTNVNMYSRSLQNWDKRHSITDVIINCTPNPVHGSNSPIDRIPSNLQVLVDVPISKEKNLHFNNDYKYFEGLDFYGHQFISQFLIYTGHIIFVNEFNFIKNDYKISI